MKVTRSRFKSALRYCRANEREIKKRFLAQDFTERSKQKFWKRVKQMVPKKTNVQSCIDGLTNENDIAEMFSKNYRLILDDSDSQAYSNEGFSDNVPDTENSRIYFQMNIDEAISKLNSVIGWDNIYSCHLKYAGDSFRSLLARLFASFLRHNYLPETMLNGQIKPFLKDNKISKALSSNYRPIMSSSVMLKTFEYSLLPCLEKSIDLNPRQFGFRKQSSCLTAITVVKETILKYNSAGSNVHVASIDLSKAFDKVSHNLLYEKLCNTRLPKIIIRIVHYILSNTFVNVKYGGSISEA